MLIIHELIVILWRTESKLIYLVFSFFPQVINYLILVIRNYVYKTVWFNSPMMKLIKRIHMLSCTSSLSVVKIESLGVFILGAGAVNFCSIKTDLVHKKNKSSSNPLLVISVWPWAGRGASQCKSWWRRELSQRTLRTICRVCWRRGHWGCWRRCWWSRSPGCSHQHWPRLCWCWGR